MLRTEYEKKILLSEKEYRLLSNLFFQGQVPQKQRNFYYDTPDRSFHRRNITVRVREKNGEFLGTIKTHMGSDSDASSEENFLTNEFPDWFEYEGLWLSFQGELVTERLKIDLGNQLVLALDCNHYLGKTDYELELEYLPNQYAEAEGILTFLQKILKKDPPYERSMSKSHRFFLQMDKKRERRKPICFN